MTKTRSFLLAAGIALALAFTFSCTSDGSLEDGGGGGYTGSYDSIMHGGQTHKTVVIGTQTWMAENLNYDAEGSKCYDDDPANCGIYGRLYDWATALTVCPPDWHLPTQAEWNVMTAYIGGEKTEGKKLKVTSGWNSNGNGTDDYGFSALPGGRGYSDGSFFSAGRNGLWWSASENSSDSAYGRHMHYSSENAHWGYGGKSGLFSVRCVKD